MQTCPSRLKARSLQKVAGIKGRIVNFSAAPGEGLSLLTIAVGRALGLPVAEFRPILSRLGESLADELQQMVRPFKTR